MARWLLLTVVLAASLAGCLRPLASDAEPDRESVDVPRGEFFGEPVATNGTMRVSLVPGEVAGPVSEEPLNCFVIEDADQERTSYLGGVSVDLTWSPASAMTEALNVTVWGTVPYGAGTFIFLQSLEGTSPLHVVHADALEDDSRPFATPVRVVVKPAGTALPVPDQPVAWTVTVGILESAISAVAWRHCDLADMPLPAPPTAAALPRTSSVTAD